MFVACALVASMACTSKGAGMSGNTADTHAQDLAAIEKLRQQDIAATLAGDLAAIAELDEAQMATWVKQAAALPGWTPVARRHPVKAIIAAFDAHPGPEMISSADDPCYT
jgi:hypothetical protein